MTSRGWRLILPLAGIVYVSALAAIARRGAPTWPVADGALIEIYTRQAWHGEQLLGAYSQYGWYHPGPLLFYLLAPFYAISGQTLYGLDLGALAVNLAALGIIAAVIGRRRGLSPPSALLLFIGLFVYLVRLPDLLTSAWNPHISVWPFAALLVCTAATVDGELWWLPAAAALASLVTQTHVGFAPVALVLGIIAVAGGCIATVIRHERLTRWTAPILWSIVILQLIWLPAFAEELTGHPGNLTKIWHFFVDSAGTQTASDTFRAWSSMLAGLLRPDLTIASGLAYTGSSRAWPLVVGLLGASALPVAAALRWRRADRFEAILAVVCFVASLAGFWSVRHIHGLIGDYQLFWLSILGVFSLAITLGLAGSLVPLSRPSWATSKYVGTAAALFVAGAVAIGSGHLVLATRPAPLPEENDSVRRLSADLQHNLRSMGARKPLFRMEGGPWSIGAGLMLQLARSSVPFAADADVAARFDPNLAPTGDEDVLITLSGPDAHRQLMARRGNVTLAESHSRLRLFVDAVSLVDHPEYRSGTP